MRNRNGTRLGVLALALASAFALVAGTASANTITVGSVLPPGAVSEEVKEVDTFFNTALPEKGASLASPVSGVIVRWRLVGAKGGPFFLRILRPNGLGAYTAVGTSGGALPISTSLQTFNANLPIKSGDLLAVDPTNPTDELGFVPAAGAAYSTIFPTPFEGATVPSREPVSGKEIELSAEVQPTPALKALSATVGPVTGGTEVKITGSDFTGASAVKFGTVPAATFKVESDSEIVVTAPKSAKVTSVDVTVTTLAGTSAAVRDGEFSYRGCVVPKLAGKKLGKVKSLLKGGNCKLGKVTLRKGVSRQTGKVKQQSPQPKKVLAPGTKVKVTLG
ncbi:MAG TPA: IPT/TIG domain-containing protein [Solirubrobacterales bacterium]|nr:IPT/TIG domain-containing protein [Solirubrobacterales bacterium]